MDECVAVPMPEGILEDEAGFWLQSKHGKPAEVPAAFVIAHKSILPRNS